MDSGELRLLFVLADFDGLDHGVWVEDMKTGLRSWVRDHSAWHRFALGRRPRVGRRLTLLPLLGRLIRPAQPPRR